MATEQPDQQEPRFVLRILTNASVPLRRFHLPPGEYTVGSAASADILLPVSGVSRTHARLEIGEDGPAVLVDLGSRNGTFVEGARTSRAEVAHQVRVAFGPVLGSLAPVDEMTDAIQVGDGGRVVALAAAPPEPVGSGGSAAAPAPLDIATAERLAERSGLVVGLLVRGGVTTGEAALQLAREWFDVLRAARVELAHEPAAGPREVMSVTRPGVAQTKQPPVETEGEAGWSMTVHGATGGDPVVLRPLARVCLAALAAATSGSLAKRTVTPLSLQEAVHRAERDAYLAALARAGGDPGRAAELLGVSRSTCQRKLKDLGIG
jgi:hypothetical protein